MAAFEGIKWSRLERWDFKFARIVSFRDRNPTFVKLGEYLEEATELVDPRAEPETDWPVYGVNNRDGVFLNEMRSGQEFNQSQKRIYKNWFFHNPTRANVGSFGRVPDVETNAITSPEYQVWRLKEGSPTSPEFIEILIKTPLFLQQVQYHRVGAVKERLYTENLMEILVPSLELIDQDELIKTVSRERAKLEAARIALANSIESAGKALEAFAQ